MSFSYTNAKKMRRQRHKKTKLEAAEIAVRRGLTAVGVVLPLLARFGNESSWLVQEEEAPEGHHMNYIWSGESNPATEMRVAEAKVKEILGPLFTDSHCEQDKNTRSTASVS